MEEEKIQAIRDYLQKHFPNASHADMIDSARKGQQYKITTVREVMLMSISRKLIEDFDSPSIISKLERFNLIDILKKYPDSIVIVRSSGIKIKPRN